MDQKDRQEQQVIDRYLKNELPAEELEAFETRCMVDSELRAAVDAAENELEKREADEMRELVDAARAGKNDLLSDRPSWATVINTPQYAAAASVLLVVSLVFSGLLYQENIRLTGQGLSAGPISRLEPIFVVRGGADGRTIAPGVAGESVVLLLDPGSADHVSFRATISREIDGATQQVSRVDGLEPGYEALLAVGIPGNLVVPGDYEVLIEGRMAEWPAGQYEAITRVSFRAANE